MTDPGLAAYETVLRKPAPRSWVAWVVLGVLAVCAVFVWSFGLWLDVVKVRDFHAFEQGLARTCLAEGMTYERGKCKAPEVQLKLVPFNAWPNAEPGSPLEAEPLGKKPKDETTL